MKKRCILFRNIEFRNDITYGKFEISHLRTRVEEFSCRSRDGLITLVFRQYRNDATGVRVTNILAVNDAGVLHKDSLPPEMWSLGVAISERMAVWESIFTHADQVSAADDSDAARTIVLEKGFRGRHRMIISGRDGTEVRHYIVFPWLFLESIRSVARR